MGIFYITLMTLTDNLGNPLAKNLPCQIDNQTIPIALEVQGQIPVDYFDLFSLGWISPVPQRGQYLVDQATGIQYSIYGRVAVYTSHLEVRVSLPLGILP